VLSAGCLQCHSTRPMVEHLSCRALEVVDRVTELDTQLAASLRPADSKSNSGSLASPHWTEQKLALWRLCGRRARARNLAASSERRAARSREEEGRK